MKLALAFLLEKKSATRWCEIAGNA
ncbi:UNVERIFIED_CONTAM: hypothetical protein GTU68_018360 [Idotea baltica]|nr:hypothetical protein [Idotea baltica]